MDTLFVYGSLRSGFKSPAYEYISKYFCFLGNAKVKGELYDMGHFPAAIPTHENRFLVGELYCINDPEEFEWALAQLDDYEGINPESGIKPDYKREQVQVYLGKDIIPAWIYWYNLPIYNRPLIESGDVLDFIRLKQMH